MKFVLDTSVFIKRELATDATDVPDDAAVSVVTLAELEIGVLTASPEDRAKRMRTLEEVAASFDHLPVDRAVAHNYAEIVATARRLGRRPRVLDSLIAATAVAHGAAVYTADTDFSKLPGVEIVTVR